MDYSYTIVCDGGTKGGNPGNGYGSYIISVNDGTGRSAHTGVVFGPGCTNNVAEYKVMIAALRDLLGRIDEPNLFSVEVMTDSKLVWGQVSQSWKIKSKHLLPLVSETRKLLGKFRAWRINKVPREYMLSRLGH